MAPNQPRDWHGRWTTGGSRANPAVRGYASRRGAISSQVYKTGSRPRVKIGMQESATVAAARYANRRAGAPVGGNRNVRLQRVRTTTKVHHRGLMKGTTQTTVVTRGRVANYRAARTYNRTGRAPVGSYITAPQPKG